MRLCHVVLLLQALAHATAGPYEKLLYADLLADYNPLVRPVLNESVPVRVKLGLDLQSIIEVDEKEQSITTNVWLRFEWWDAYLRWEPERYGNISEVRLPVSSVWRPDILLYNSADQAFDTTYHSQAVVYSDGTINWMPPGIIKSSCKIDITYFPFDDQRCLMKFGSWSNSGKQINLLNDTVELSTFVKNGEWILMGAPGRRNTIKYECCPDPYYDVTFTIWIRRRTLYYNLNLVVPCILISALALLGFTLPPDSGEKISLGVTIFMSLCVTMLMVAESMPQTSDAVPLIAIYFSCIIYIEIKSIFLKWLPWLLRMTRPGESELEFKLHSSSPSHLVKKRPSKSLLSNVLDIEEEMGSMFGKRRDSGTPVAAPVLAVSPRPPSYAAAYNDASNYASSGSERGAPRREEMAEGRSDVYSILRELRFLTDRLRAEDEDEEVGWGRGAGRGGGREGGTVEVMNDWKWAAMVADRLSLVLCAAFLVICTIIFGFSAPHLFV